MCFKSQRATSREKEESGSKTFGEGAGLTIKNETSSVHFPVMFICFLEPTDTAGSGNAADSGFLKVSL